jgi:hypothetical protein
MTEVAKIVHDRLQAAAKSAAQERVHPDADLLTALAEQALSMSERESIFEHLALCEDCREVVALALPAVESKAPMAGESDVVRTNESMPERAARRPIFAWPNLRWAALAAGVAVVTALVIVRPARLNLAFLPSASHRAARPMSGTQTASGSPVQNPVLGKGEEARPQAEMQLPPHLPPAIHAGLVVAPTRPTQSGMMLAGNRKKSGVGGNLSGAEADATAFNYGAPASGGSAEVSTASSELAVAPSAADKLIARNEAPAIEKAKPAPQAIQVEGSDAQVNSAVVAPGAVRLQARNMAALATLKSPLSRESLNNATWAITAGVLRRSLDGGQSWQETLRADHPLLCYARQGEDVWAGGEAGTLFHSIDSGLTWVQVKPSANSQQLSSNVTRIDVPNTAEITVSATNNEVWTSSDGGKSWNKK